MLFTPYFSCPFCTFPPSIFVFMAVFFNFLYTYTKTKAHTVCGRAQASILLSFWRRLNDDMGEKVVRRKHLKTANQGVDGRFSRSFLLLLLFFFFHKPSQPCEKCYRKSNNKSKFREQRYAYLSDLWPTISQQRGQSLDGREKKRCTLQTWCQKTLQTHRKGRPSGKLTWYEPHSDHLEYLTRQHITKIHPVKHRTSWDSYHASPTKNVTLDMLWELYSIPHSLENIRKHKGEHSGH